MPQLPTVPQLPTPAINKPVLIDDARFKQLLTYINQVLQSRSQTAARYFEGLDLDRDTKLRCTEFINGLTSVGVSGVERAELVKVFGRIEGTGSEFALAPVSSIVSAITDPTGFVSTAAAASPPIPGNQFKELTMHRITPNPHYSDYTLLHGWESGWVG